MMPTTADVARLHAQVHRFLPQMSEEAFALLTPLLAEKILGKGEVFSRTGIIATEIGFVLDGALHHYYTHDGVDRSTYFYFEDHFVASYISAIKNQPSALTIEALTPCRLLVFPYGHLRNLFDASPVWERFGRLLAEYLAAGLEERMAGLLMLSPEERYRALLAGGREKILARIPQHLIASYLGVTPVSLSRIRARVARG
jgi:CRP-like cAMP-binding protein